MPGSGSVSKLIFWLLPVLQAKDLDERNFFSSSVASRLKKYNLLYYITSHLIKFNLLTSRIFYPNKFQNHSVLKGNENGSGPKQTKSLLSSFLFELFCINTVFFRGNRKLCRGDLKLSRRRPQQNQHTPPPHGPVPKVKMHLSQPTPSPTGNPPKSIPDQYCI